MTARDNLPLLRRRNIIVIVLCALWSEKGGGIGASRNNGFGSGHSLQEGSGDRFSRGAVACAARVSEGGDGETSAEVAVHSSAANAMMNDRRQDETLCFVCLIDKLTEKQSREN